MKKIQTFISLLILSTVSLAETKYESGIGIVYGGILGTSVNVDINSSTEVYLGLGLTAGESLGMTIGSRLWINDKVRLTGNYGYNCTVKTVTIGTSTTTSYKDYRGINVGIGYAPNGKDSSGFSFDAMIVDNSDCKDAAKGIVANSASTLTVALGYRF